MPEVTYQHNGHILCDECATYWCVHVEEVVKKNLDVNFIWEQYPGTQKIAVPIIPTANQWAMVELVEPDVHGVPTYEAWIDSGHSGIPDASLFGFIHECLTGSKVRWLMTLFLVLRGVMAISSRRCSCVT
jgi:hypothetical protein